jgi:hypothetical protein
MSGVLKALVVVFLFIIELVVDIICCALFVCALAAFWRIPSWPGELELGSRKEFRLSALYAFGTSLFDLITLPFLVLMLGTWRSVATVNEIAMAWNKKGHYSDGRHYFVEGRMCVWRNFFMLFADIPFIS